MSVAKVVEILPIRKVFRGCHPPGASAGVQNHQEHARSLDQEQQVQLREGQIVAYRVNMKVTFVLNE